MMRKKETHSPLEEFFHTRRTRRYFFKLMLGGAASLMALSGMEAPLAADDTAQPASPDTKAPTLREWESALQELDTDFILNPISRDSFLLDQRNNPDAAVQAAQLETPLDEPVTTLVSKTEGTETGADGDEITYTEYKISYDDQEFLVRAKVLDSENFPTLNSFFNVGYDDETFINKKITSITFNSDAQATPGLDKITVYCLKEYKEDDLDAPTFALNPAFYEESTDEAGTSILHLKEELLVLLLAEAFNRHTIVEGLSKSCNIGDFNHYRNINGDREIHNSTVIISKKIEGSYSALSLFYFEKAFPSDTGANFNSRLVAPERSMQTVAGVHAHELGHGIDMLYKDNTPVVGLYGGIHRDRLGESHANMCRADYWLLSGDRAQAEVSHSSGLREVFSINLSGEYEGMYDFKSYTPMLFVLLIEQYREVLAEVADVALEPLTSKGKISVEGLQQLHFLYMKLRNEMFEVLGSSWYVDRMNNLYWADGNDRKSLEYTFQTICMPGVYARYKLEGIDISQDKEAFMEAVAEEVDVAIFKQRLQLLTDVATNNPETRLPYFQVQFEEAWKTTILTLTEFTNLPQPELGETLNITRKVDPVYFKENLENTPDYYYRNYYPYYFTHTLDKAPDDQEFVIEKTVADDDFVIVVIEPHFFTNPSQLIENGTRAVLLANTPFTLNPDKVNAICVVDKRKNQFEDDLAKQETPLFTLTARQRPVPPPTPETPPPPTPEPPTPTPTPELPVPPTPTPGSTLNLPQIKS